MKYIYNGYPTKKEIIVEYQGVKKAETVWRGLKQDRLSRSEKVSLENKNGDLFWYVLTPHILDLMTKIAEQRGFLEGLSLPSNVIKRFQDKATNYEAYYSSHIEGAISSLEEALRFIKKKQKYSKDESLQMIGNNQRALEYALKQTGRPITHELIWKLQHILTENTHKERPITRGEYRHGPIYVVNGLGQVIYEGPPATKVHKMMSDFIKWMNATETISPLIKAAIVHLYFVHVHPFDDGNGRTARALSNLILASMGFKFINMLSLSSFFDHKRPSYYKAIQDVREHDHDLTYFIIFYLEALFSRIDAIKNEIAVETKVKNIKEILSAEVYQRLNRRQIKALRYMIQNKEIMTTRKYCKLNNCSDETARKDFSLMTRLRLMNATGKGRSRGYELSGEI